MDCWECLYSFNVQRKFGVTTHCNAEPTKMDVTYCYNHRKFNILCPFFNKSTRYPDIDYGTETDNEDN